jgi:hypothetical protein
VGKKDDDFGEPALVTPIGMLLRRSVWGSVILLSFCVATKKQQGIIDNEFLAIPLFNL